MMTTIQPTIQIHTKRPQKVHFYGTVRGW